MNKDEFNNINTEQKGPMDRIRDESKKTEETSVNPFRQQLDHMEGLPPEELTAREQARLERQLRRQRELRSMRIRLAAMIAALVAVAGVGVFVLLNGKNISLFGGGRQGEGGQATTIGVGTASGNAQEEGQASDKAAEGADGTGMEASADAADAQNGADSAVSSVEVAEGTADGAGSAENAADGAEAADNGDASETEEGQTDVQSKETEAVASGTPSASGSVTERADYMAMQYDYDGAIALLKAEADYDSNTGLQAKAAEYESAKASLVAVDPTTAVHVFVHCLIVDPSRAFDGDGNERGYNLNMVTIDEFKKIIQSMYDKGYVLISLHDMGYIDENGNMVPTSIYLPEGKKPLVFSQDDISYYHTYTNDGFADKLVVDENGEVKNQYTDADGNVSIGDYDMVPVLDTFIREHPDFSYHGRKGIICLTGYNGILGYRTDGDYRDRLHLQQDQQAWLDAHPDFDFDADVAEAKKVAEAMKADGWEFASHTWGHIAVADVSLENLQTDTQKWHDYVESVVGDTDMIIFAFGSDIGDWTGYADDNSKYQYLKSMGFDYFCNVDGSTLSWVQFGKQYLRTGRMNIDGYRMATNPGILEPLFNVEEVYDYTNRPSMSEWTQGG